MNSLVSAHARASVPAFRAASEASDEAAMELERLWSLGPAPSVEALWNRFAPDGSVDVLAALIKADLRCRFERGEGPDVASYLARFAALRATSDRVVSLVYEEYCLREERGEHLDPDSFCARYDPWRDSLLSQLRYHRLLSQAVGAAPSVARLPSAGERFRSFRLRSVLGQGGTARVFLAHDESLGDRVVALKVSTDRGKEPAIQGRLDHAHIVPVLSVTDDPETGLRGLCMPYRAGLSLDAVIRQVDPASRPKRAAVLREVVDRQALDAAEDRQISCWPGFPERGTYAQGVAWLVSIVARALAYAHSQGVHHRDIKPANVLLTGRDGPQLLDFNLAHSPHSAGQAEAALRGGTLPYMAPEQLEAFLDPERWDEVGPAADIYALGLLLRELLTGRRPEGPDPSAPLPRAIRELLDRRARGQSPARELNPDIPHALDAILARCLETRPEGRYSCARALAEDLARFVNRQPLVEAVNPSRLEQLGNLARRWRLGRWALISAASVAVTVGAVLLLRSIFAPKEVKYYVVAAQAAAGRHEWDKARQHIEMALGLAPDYYLAHAVNAQVYSGERKHRAAASEMDVAVKLAKPGTPDLTDAILAQIWTQKGAASLMIGDNAAAESAYRKALELEPRHHNTAYLLATSFAKERGDHAGVEEYLTKAIDGARYLGMQVEPATLARYYCKRAQARVNLGNAVPRPEGSSGLLPRLDPEFRRAEGYFKAAGADLAAARRLAPSPSKEDAFDRDCAEASVKMGLGDLASEREDYTLSVRHFEAAQSLLEQAMALGMTSRDAQALRGEIDRRLETDRPKKLQGL